MKSLRIKSFSLFFWVWGLCWVSRQSCLFWVLGGVGVSLVHDGSTGL